MAIVSVRQPGLIRWPCLHCHSTASDGALTPRAVGEIAALLNVRDLALTDHETLAGWRELRDHHPATLTVWPGVELWVRDQQDYGHLTLLFDPRAERAIEALIARPRAERTLTEVARLPVVALTGCQGSPLWRRARNAAHYWASVGETLARWQTLFGDRLFFEVHPVFPDPWPELLAVARTLHLPICVTEDAHGTTGLPFYRQDEILAFHSRHQASWRNALAKSQGPLTRLHRLARAEWP